MSDPDLPSAVDEPRGGFIRRHLVALSVAAVAGTALAAWLAFGYFGIQTLWTDDEVDEAGPVFESGVSADEAPAADPASDGWPGSDGPTTTAAPTIETLAQGRFIPRDHPAEGNATVIGDGSEQRFLRFTEFATDNGPDLNVYLSTAAPDADSGAFDDDFVDLGDLKGNVGDQNYELPPDVDLDRYRSVVIWCVRFASPFGAAPLDAA